MRQRAAAPRGAPVGGLRSGGAERAACGRRLFIERAELEEQDIVTYAFGDMNALYLRGQWTIHRNDKQVNTVWRQCKHLGVELQKELGLKVSYLKQMEAAGKKTSHLRFVSAEGCYSYEVARARLRFKIALKQSVGIDAASTDQVVAAGGATWVCGGDESVDSSLLRKMLARTEREPCRTLLPPLQRPVGTETKIEVDDQGCGKWFPPEFRMCAQAGRLKADDVAGGSASVAVYSREGDFFVQGLDDAGLGLPGHDCRQVAFFHFQVG